MCCITCVYLHQDQVISPCDVGESVIGPDLVHVVGEDGHDEPAGVVARPGPRLVVARVVHIHDHLKRDLRLGTGCLFQVNLKDGDAK